MAERLNDRRFTFKNDIVSLKKKEKKKYTLNQIIGPLPVQLL